MKISAIVSGMDEVQKLFRGLKDNAPHAQRITANTLGEMAQREARAGLSRRFMFRGTRQGFERAIVLQKAKETPRGPVAAELVVGAAFGSSATTKLGRILARHEEAESRTHTGQVAFNSRGKAIKATGFFLPAKGLRTASANPPRRMYPAAVGAAMRLTPDSRLIIAKGTRKATKQRAGESYFATEKGIFRRVHSGFGRAEAQAIWWFRGRVRTPARLGLWDTARQVVDAHSLRVAAEAVETVIRRSR